MRLLHFAGVVGRVATTFVLGLVIAFGLHLHTPRARRLVAEGVDRVLAASFRGQVRIERLVSVGFFGVSGVDATVDDPAGRRVVVIRGGRASVATLALIRSALLGHAAPLAVRLPDVSFDSLDVRLDTDDKGKLGLIKAFEPRSPSSSSGAATRGIRLVLDKISLKKASAAREVTGSPLLDVRIDSLEGAFAYAPDLIEGSVSNTHIAARGIANGADLDGRLRASAKKKTADNQAGWDARVTWQGAVGSIDHFVDASLENDHVDAIVDVPEVRPADVERLWSHSSMDEVGRAHVEAHGTLPNVDVDLEVTLGEASLRGKANLILDREKKGKIVLVARDVDAHEFAVAAPRSRLGASGRGWVTLSAEGALTGQVTARFVGGTLGAYRLPPAALIATVSRSDPDDLRAHGQVTVQDPAVAMRLSVELSPKGSSSMARFALDADLPDLDRVDEFRHSLRGSGRVTARGSLDVANMAVDASLEAVSEELSLGATSARRISLDAHAAGPLVDPLMDVALHSSDIAAKGIRVASADVQVHGRAAALHVTASARGPDIPDTDASLDVALGADLSMQNLRVGMARAGEHAVLAAGRLRFAGKQIRGEAIRLEGLGAPADADVEFVSDALRMRVSAPGIDLACVGGLLHMEQTLERGTLILDANLDLRRSDAYGRVYLDLRQANIRGVHEVSARLRAQVNGSTFDGAAQARAEGLGFIDVNAPRLSLGRAGALSLAAWRRAWGDVAIDGRVDLEKLGAVIPPESFPLSEARGQVIFKGHIERDDLDDVTPDVSLSVTTERLALAPRTAGVRTLDGEWVMQPPPWTLSGVDFNMSANVDGDSGALGVAAQLRDGKGELAHMQAKSAHPPWEALLHDSGRLAADIRKTPFELQVSIPERGLGKLPPLLRQDYLTGKLQGDLSASGTINAPRLHVAAALKQSHIGANARAGPLEFTLTADYDQGHGSVALGGTMRGAEVIEAQAELQGAVADLLDSGVSSASWQAAARAHWVHFPLEAVALLDDKLISGELNGDLTLEGFHKDARASAQLEVDALRVGSVGYKSAQLAATANGSMLDGTVRVEQDDGFAETKAHATASWGAAWAPRLDRAAPAEVAVSAKSFRIAALLPFLDRWLHELDGRLDADARIALDPTGAGHVRLAGGVALTHGAVEAVAGGGEFRDIAANARFSPDGVVTLEKLTAAGMSGRVQATGAIRLDGASLRSASVAVLIPSDSPIPLDLGGSEIGNVDGRVDLSEVTSSDGRTMNVVADVAHLRVALPQGTSPHVEALGGMAKVQIGVHRGKPQTFTLLSLDPTNKKEADESSSTSPAKLVSIQTRLHDVEVMRGTDLDIHLAGRVDAKLDGATQVTGQIGLQQGGALVVQGRTFKIENGTVTFVGGDPSNPEVVVKAGWTSPDGTIVHANFVGPLKTGKVTLSSEPPLAQQEIVELLAFGAAEGTQPQSASASPATSALGTVGGEATQPLNHALRQLGLGSFTTKVDTSESSTPKPEVEVQIAKDISVQLAVVLGQPPPGVNPDRTLLSLDWRFLSRWSLLSTLGDAGTAIFDLLWQRRY